MRTSRFLRQRHLLALLTLLALVAAACGSGSTATETGGGEGSEAAGGTEAAAGGDASTLVVGGTEVPSHLDPAVVYELYASNILFNTTNRLVEAQPGTGEIGPGVAEEWEISDDGLTYTFTLREGVTFQDGSDLTSEDVKWSLERAVNINHPESAAFLLGGVESIETPDDYTVVITLSEPNATFLSRLNYTVATILPSDGDAYTAPDQALEEPSAGEAEEYINDETIVGSGPYELTDYRPGESMTLEAFDDYWGDPPAIDTVQVQFFEDTAQMRNAMAAGEIDFNWNEFAPAERASLTEEEGMTISQTEGGRIRYIVIDVTAAPFDDPEVRRAMSASIDRQRIIDEVFEGAGVPLYSMIPSTFDVNADYMADIEAEVPEGTEIELWYPLNKYGDTEADVAETIARSLEEAGFTVTTQSADWAAEYSDNTTTGTYSVYLLGWYPDYIDPDAYIDPFYGGGYIPYYQDEEMQQLIRDEQTAEIGSEERAQIFDEIQQKAAEDMPYIPLYEEGQTVYHADSVTGVEETLTPAQQTWYYVLSKEG
ncbi:MAG TPA: ABC transporter substrate-binding protein [Euzebyales bacterium]